MSIIQIITLIMGVIQIFGGIIVVMAGWLVKRMYTDMKDIERRLEETATKDELKLVKAKVDDIPKEYVMKEDYKEVMNRIFTKLDQIFNKLDAKEDKH